jgi:hypothetical protein
MNVTFFLKLGTFFKNYFGKLDKICILINKLCINKLCQIGEYAYVNVNYHI